ncbi:MAG: hypothetical protein C0606_07255 [Hyphomicrobiales bacterium]|nr:MAG: hypothetical protein C0606_07255 [Hyphomicrobiales bacterium]
MTTFPSTTVSYYEDRADGGYAWNVRYDLQFGGQAFNIKLKVDLVGDDPGTLASVWLNGANSIWNNNVCFADGKRMYEVKFDMDWVNSGAHQVVTVVDGYGRTNMTTWYTSTSWDASYQDQIAAHEVGHMLGNFDEYSGGATYNGYTTTGSLMSDLVVDDMERYYWGVEYFAEQYSGLTLSTVEIYHASNASTWVTGTAGQDALFAHGGDDHVAGRAGGDLIRGGSGSDKIFGEYGNDVLFGEVGRDTLNGGYGADTLNGGVYNDVLYGRIGRDVLLGGGQADKLFGNQGYDTLKGGGGNDVLTGGPGNDRLLGNFGADRFVFDDGFDRDRIVDFTPNVDTIDLRPYSGLANFSDVTIRANPAGYAVVDLGSDEIVLVGVTPSQLDAGDFLV